MKVLNFPSEHPCENIVRALRNIADDIENNEYGFEPTLAVLVLGRESQQRELGGFSISFDHQTHGLGDATVFSARGLLASAVAQFGT